VINKKNIIYFFFLTILVIFGIYCSISIGKSWDTFFFVNIGKERLSYLLSFGLLANDENFVSQLYPATYNTLSAFFLQLFPKTFELEGVHLINFTFSFIASIGVYKVSKKLFNKEIGVLSFIIFIFYPIFYGHMAINDRDTIVTFSNIWITFYSLQYLKLNSYKNKKYIYYLGFLLALGMGVRFAFVATLIPIFIYILFLLKKKTGKNINFKKIFFDLFKIIFIALFVTILFWVPTHENLLVKPFELIKQSFQYGWGYPFALLNGEVFKSDNVPNTYLIKNLFFKTPEYILALYLILLFSFFKMNLFFKKKIKDFNTKVIFILFNLILPNILLAFSPFSVYDGMRLFIFVLPYFSIFPAIMIFFLYKNYNFIYCKVSLFFVLFLKLYYLYIFLILTPYHYTYLNIFSGKFYETNKKFENDYWGTSLKELSKKIKKNKTFMSKPYTKFSICGVGKGSVKYYLNKIENFNYKIVDKNNNPDYVIIANRVLWDYDKNKSSKIITCFDKYDNSSVIEVKRNGLVLSAVKNIN